MRIPSDRISISTAISRSAAITSTKINQVQEFYLAVVEAATWILRLLTAFLSSKIKKVQPRKFRNCMKIKTMIVNRSWVRRKKSKLNQDRIRKLYSYKYKKMKMKTLIIQRSWVDRELQRKAQRKPKLTQEKIINRQNDRKIRAMIVQKSWAQRKTKLNQDKKRSHRKNKKIITMIIQRY